MKNPTPKPQPDSAPSVDALGDHEEEPTLRSINRRLTNVERLMLSIQSQMTPKWLRFGAWGTFVGACIKVILGGQ